MRPFPEIAPEVVRRSLSSTGLLRQSALAVVTALLLLFSFPPFDFHLAAWISLVPLLFVIAGGAPPSRAFWLGWMVGIEFTFFAENWIAHSMTVFGGMLTVVSYAVALLFAAILALFPALFAWVMARLVILWGVRAMAFAPMVWAATEWVRPFVTGVTWNALGVSQYRNYFVARLAQYGGVYLISAVVVAGNTLSVMAAMSVRKKSPAILKPGILLLFCMGITFILAGSSVGIDPDSVQPVTVVGVQPNLPPDKTTTRSDLENNFKLTREAIARSPEKKADLVIWAESPLSLFYESDDFIRGKIDSLANETRSHFIFNAVAQQGERYFNSVQTVTPLTGSQSHRRYDKIRLVPFGEYVPFNSLLKYVVPRVISSDSGGFAAGTEAVVNLLKLETQRGYVISGDQDGREERTLERRTTFVRTGAFICYEAAYPDLVRQFVKNGATLLINVSNDAWFGTTAGPRQHLAHAVMRAVENDRDLLRVTNSGISALITAQGQVSDPMPTFAAASQIWRAKPRSRLTFYTRHGDWFAAACAALTLFILAMSLAKKSPKSPKT